MNDILATESRGFVADHYHALDGFTEPRHGHNWELEATVSNEESDRLGAILDACIKEINYSLLNELQILSGRNPTAEAVAECVFNYLVASKFSPVEVRVREKPQYWASCLRLP